MSTNKLTFTTLREGNVKRLPMFKGNAGNQAHSKADGSDWSPAQWLQAVIGELGEYANLRKKVERGDLTEDEAREKLASEIADVVVYLDILAFRQNIDLGAAVEKCWNAKSKQVGAPILIGGDGVTLLYEAP